MKKFAFVTVIPVLLLACDNGAGTFGDSQQPLFVSRPGSSIALPIKPSDVAVADLNKDGQLDLVIASEESRSVAVLMGDKADASFRAATARTIRLPESPSEVVLGDVNGDDRLDLTFASHDSYNVTILLGEANGSFALAANSPVVMKKGQHPHTHGLGLADLNGDGKLDLATVNNEDNDVSVAFGDGRGGFTLAPRSPFAVGPSPYPLTLDDVNGDGRFDIVATASATGPARAQQLASSRALTLLMAQANGGFSRSEVPLRTGQPWFVAAGDLNGDGKRDLVATHHDQGVMTVLLGDGTGNFREIAGSPFDLGGNVWQIVLADVNRDGRQDVIAAAGDGVRVMLGDGTGRFEQAGDSPVPTPKGTWRLAVGDINNDGKTDVITTNTDSNSVTVLFRS